MTTHHDESDELRIALAIRGGVSLAVWIGGATAEIGQLRRPDGDAAKGSAFWTSVRDAAGYGNVIVDIMSGASAGGLNAVIGAASVAYGFELDEILDVWLELGDFDKLLRPVQGDMPANGLPSLMMGDEFFFAELAGRLNALATAQPPPPTPPRVDVTLVGTLLRPVERERIRGDADTTETRFTTTFRFRSGQPMHSDFPTDADGRSRAVNRLALAGRATSSFPVAFEAAEVFAQRPASFASAAVGANASGDASADFSVDRKVGMTGLFGEASAMAAPFGVMDGGVLDNIPIGRAISAIMDAPASRPTRRALIYVQPGSAGTAVDAQVNKYPRSTAAVLEAIVRTRVQEETIAGDLAQLEAHNERARRVRSNAAAALTALPKETNPRGRYRTQRATIETETVMRLLDDPIASFGGDPFPDIPIDDADREPTEQQRAAWPKTVDSLWRSPLTAAWDPSDAAKLAASLTQHIDAELEGGVANVVLRRAFHFLHGLGIDQLESRLGPALAGPITIGAGPLRRLAQLLIDASRSAHDCAPTAGGDAPSNPANELKARLYRVLTVHAELVERPRCLAWVVLAATTTPTAGDVDGWVSGALARVENVTRSTDVELVERYLDAHEAGRAGMAGTDATGAGNLDTADAQVRDHLDRLLNREPDGQLGGDVRDLLWDRLCTIAGELRDIALDDDEVDERCAKREVGPLVLRWLRTSKASPADALEALEFATFDSSTNGEVGATPVSFFRLSGANSTPLAAAFPILLDQRPEADPMATIVSRLRASVTSPSSLTASTKLAGNELMNFSAFLKRSWRANDWMWGRLDAVPTMVQIVLEPARLLALAKRIEADKGRDHVVREMLDTFEDIVRRSGTHTNTDDWQSFLADTAWAPRLDKITRLCQLAADGAEISVADVAPLCEALVAARQWDIIAELLPTVESAPQAGAGATPPDRERKAIIELANRYDVGVQTINDLGGEGDPKRIRNTVLAARGVLAQAAAEKKARPVLLAVGAVVSALSWLWLQKTAPKIVRALLLLGGLACLTVPALVLTDGDWKAQLIAATAGIAGLVIVAGVVIFLVRSQGAGFALVLGGIALAMWACWGGTMFALAVVLAPIGTLALVAGAVVLFVLRAKPSISRR